MVQLSPKTQETAPQTLSETITLDVQGMKCAGCVKAVERQLSQQSGVISACVNLITEVAVIQYVPGQVQPANLAEKLTAVGFPSDVRDSHTLSLGETSQNVAQRKQKEAQQQRIALTTAAILLVFSGLGHLHHIGGPSLPLLSSSWFHWGLATLALLIPGREIIIDGWRGLRHGMANMNTLVALGTLSAYLASCIALLFPNLGWECFFEEPVMLLGFILLGRTLEKKARNRASAALEALISLQPPVARLIGDPFPSDSPSIEIPVEQVRLGEWIRVLPGEKIPVDGEIITGQTLIDESLVTGESLPVPKQPGEGVIAGTINQSGVITVKTTRIGLNTTLAQIIASVEEAQTRKAPIQKLADTMAGYFAYGVMAIASLTFLFWLEIGTKVYPQVLMTTGHHLTMNSPILLSLKLMIAVLVVACPCALGLATPTAILVGTGIGAEKGLLIKGGDVLETVHQLNAIVFDKTGTLTVGHPSVTDCLTFTSLNKQELLQLAATVESGTNHPLASAMVEAAQQQDLPLLKAQNFHTEGGLGVSAIIDKKTVLLGNQDWLSHHHIPLNHEILFQGELLTKAGKTVVYLALDGEIQGMIALKDSLRPDAQATVLELQKRGLEVILVTGDHPQVANAIATQLGINQVFAQIRPQGKAAIIQQLQQSKIVAMVGDGINDAPALAQANLGITLQGSTQVAIETADIVLMGNRLRDVVGAIDLSLATFTKIRQNLLWALGYNTLAVPIAAGLLLPSFGLVISPAFAGALMALSSITVVSNSLLLRRQPPRGIMNYKL
ncbi:heavy metal translocating P-type ATPase [Aphanothece sacrum]|uniref:Cation-transporting P-type ATPase n=1 Tax=Aphanothece sacrum FPU1 TaxID=1920663 RepID=A0A401IE25_APHSA|nr:heavy metal translocating P-type ATPase [Aphanothece sacrum]GBF79525.1 cation-transporting P-type ATPase [Aphanothece sacrum FPU1]GBF83934.1 cation-transporting P-type ATPase [Aphanothece sacrum FPU3]